MVQARIRAAAALPIGARTVKPSWLLAQPQVTIRWSQPLRLESAFQIVSAVMVNLLVGYGMARCTPAWCPGNNFPLIITAGPIEVGIRGLPIMDTAYETKLSTALAAVLL